MKKSKRMSEAISGTESKKIGGCGYMGCALFSLPFLLAGLAVLYFLTVGPALKIREARNWNPTPCVIISSEVDSSSDGDTFAVAIHYSYTIDGRQYQSDRYDFFSGSTSGYEGKAEIVRQYPAGTTATCYVNPSDPEDAVFHREFSSDMWFGLFGLPFFLAGAVGLFLTARIYIKQRKGATEAKAELQGTPLSSFNPISYPTASPVTQSDSFSQSLSINPVVAPGPSPAQASPGGRVVLESPISPGCRLTGMAVIAVIWNTIVTFVSGWPFITGFSTNSFSWVLDLLFSPFHIIGMLLVVAVIYYFLALFNPHPRLTLSSGQVQLGESFDLEWEFSGSARAVNRLRISLEGREEATYRRGTTTTTDKSVFATINIVDKPYGDRGSARVMIPGDTMHSFKSDNNKIVWAISVQGDIRFYPDVKESFDIEVLPKRLHRTAEL